MTTKLISANMGIILIVERDGKEEKVQISLTCPSDEIPQPFAGLCELARFLEDEFNVEYTKQLKNVELVKPKRIKAKHPISQERFNQKIKELGYKPD
jgi:hypothetical protein